jgi:hypothetical protein
METAAAILTKLAVEAIILPVYREILAALEDGASVRGGQIAGRGL